MIKGLSSQGITDTKWGEDEDDDFEEDFHESVQGSANKRSTSQGRSRSIRTKKSKREDVIRRRIESMDTEQFVEFAFNLAQEYPEIGRKIEEEEALKGGRIGKILSSIRAEIEDLASEPAYSNYWSGRSLFHVKYSMLTFHGSSVVNDLNNWKESW